MKKRALDESKDLSRAPLKRRVFGPDQLCAAEQRNRGLRISHVVDYDAKKQMYLCAWSGYTLADCTWHSLAGIKGSAALRRWTGRSSLKLCVARDADEALLDPGIPQSDVLTALRDCLRHRHEDWEMAFPYGEGRRFTFDAPLGHRVFTEASGSLWFAWTIEEE